MPDRVPGQGNCPPGQRPVTYPGMPPGATACRPIGPGVPVGGWKPVAPGYGPGYPPTGTRAVEALAAIPGSVAFPEDRQAISQYVGSYLDWLRGMR